MRRSISPRILAIACAALGASACGGGGGGGDGPVTPKPPGSPYLHLNEVMPSNQQTCQDESGAWPDWIELHNAGTEEIDLFDYLVSDDTDGPATAVHLAHLIVPAGGVLLLWADGDVTQGPNHLPFKLSAAAERVLLYGPDGVLLDRVDWTDALPDVSLARFPDGSGTFASCAAPTCNALNGASCAAPAP